MRTSIRKKFMPFLLALAMVISLMPAVTPAAEGASITPWNGTVATAFAGGTGTSADPYQIRTAEQLAYLAQQVNGGNAYSGTYFKLMEYIILNDESFTFDSASGMVKVTDGTNTGCIGTGIKGTSYNTATASTLGTWYTAAALTGTLTTGAYSGTLYTWTPIGNTTTFRFAGTFDGNSKAVMGSCINSSGTNNQGLFGLVKIGGTVKNVIVENSVIIGSASIGGIAGYSNGSITGCSNSGIVIANSMLGGIVGTNSQGTVSQCYNAGPVTGLTTYVGGIAGKNAGATVERCYNIGAVNLASTNTSDYYIGGIVGSNTIDGVTTSTTTNCYNAGGVSSITYRNGGIAGANDSGCTVSFCYNVGRVIHGTADFGSIVGRNGGTVSNCYYDKQMSPVGGIANLDTVNVAEGRTTSEMTNTGTTFTSWSTGTTGTATWILESGLYPRLTGYVDATTDYNMETTSAAYVSASPITLSYTDASTYDTVSAVKTNITVSTANSVSWASSDTSVISNSGAIGLSGNVTMTATKGSVSKIVALNVMGAPTVIPTGGSFTDTDNGKSEISGTIGWTAANPTTNITGYHIYWGSDATTKLAGNTAVVYTVSGATTASQAVAADTALPSGANYFLIYSYNAKGDSATCLAVSITDVIPVDYIVTNDTIDSTKYKVSGNAATFDTLTLALAACTGDPNSDGKLIIQLGTNSTSPLAIPQSLKSSINTTPNQLVSATYTGCVSITKNNTIVSDSYGLYIPDGKTAYLSGLKISKNSDIDITNYPFSAVYDYGKLYVEAGTAIETTKKQYCVEVNNSNAEFYMTGGSLSHDATGSGCCVYLINGSKGTISGGTISAAGENTYAVNLLTGCSLTISGTAVITGSATGTSGIVIGTSGDLTITGGTISSTSSPYGIFTSGGTVNMTGGTVECSLNSSNTVCGIYNSSAVVTISGGKISCKNTGTGLTFGLRQTSNDKMVTVSNTAQIIVEAPTGFGFHSNSTKTDGNGAVLISGGTIDVTTTGGSAISNNGTGTMSITGGSIKSNSYTIDNTSGGTVNISGGTVEATGTNTCISNSKGTVAISEANAGTPTKIKSVGTTMTLEKNTNNPSGTVFGKTFHVSNIAGATITGAINAGKNEINKDNYSSASASATGINSPAVFKAWTSDAGLASAIGKTNNVAISSLTTGANSSVTDIYIKAGLPGPTAIPTNGSFTDEDNDKDQISGSIAWTAASPTTGIDGYHIYWGSDATTTLAGNTAAVYTVSGASTASQTVSPNTARPSGANYFLIYSYNNTNGDSATCLAVQIIDLPYSYSGGSGTAADPYKIATVSDLQALASLTNSGTNYSSTYFKQTANINLNEGVTFTFDPDTGLVEVAKPGQTTYWLGTGTAGTGISTNTTFDITASVAGTVYTNKTGTTGSATFELNTYTPVGTSTHSFTGTFDGDGKTVGGIYVKGTSDNQGLFGYTGSGSTIKNVGVVNSYIKGGNNLGGVVGYNDGSTIQKCYNTGTVTGLANVGGVVGANLKNVESCYNTGSVTGSDMRVGGVVGQNQSAGSVQYSFNTGSVYGVGMYVGGVAGTNFGTLKYCYNAGVVTGVSTYVGGVVGTLSGTAAYCYYDKDKCYKTVGGIGSSTTNSSDTTNQAEGKLTSAMQGEALKTGSSGEGWTTDNWTFKSAEYPMPGKTEASNNIGGGYISTSKTITVTETSSELFKGSDGAIKAEANVDSAFSNSVEVKVTDTETDASSFGLGAGNKVYPFDISLYIKGTNTKTEPNAGYAVKLSLPIPESLLDVKEKLSIMHKSSNGSVETLNSKLTQISGAWYLEFEAKEFSPYALAVKDIGTYDESAGLPYYVNADKSETFIGFAAHGKYIAPKGVAVLVKQNPKSFSDIGAHWAKSYINFVTEREIFNGTASNTFSPEAGMTRAMFATVIGRLYERSYGAIEAMSTHSFTDCNYNDYYGKYVDWAAKEGIISGYGNGKFGPDDQISREQMAAILYRFANALGVLPADTGAALAYPDAASISSWAQKAALYCQSTGIITGRAGGNFVPQGMATRAEVAVILERLIENVIN